nr:4Fe-4S dicluster domain-containing protein [Desulfobacterales bacterium]
MVKTSFWGITKPALRYNNSVPASIKDMPVPATVTLFLKEERGKIETAARPGDSVKTGERLFSSENHDHYVVSTVTGTIVDISRYTDAYGQVYDAIKIHSQDEEIWDGEFNKEETLKSAINFLESLPGGFSFRIFSNPAVSIDTIVICGVDEDLLVTTRQQIVKSEASNINAGIEILRKITGVKNIILAVPETLSSEARGMGAKVKTVSPLYPHALPPILVKDIVKRVVPAGKRPEEVGVSVISVESVAGLGSAFGTGKIPVTKLLTVIDKGGSISNIRCRIGTPIGDVLAVCHISLDEMDRLILGGPMRGVSTYSKELPVEPNTDAILVQNKGEGLVVKDHPCINCGACVRVCPAGIQVNLLGRYIEFGRYEEAGNYDLFSCIECGLCAYVCIARRPLLQFIITAKHELQVSKHFILV